MHTPIFDRLGRRLLVGALGLCAAGLLVLPPASAGELRSATCALTISNATVIALSNHLSGESFVMAPPNLTPLAHLHRIGEPLLDVANTTEQWADNALSQRVDWTNAGARFEFRASVDPGSGDVIITQIGTCSAKKLSGISWGLANIPDSFEVLVPGCSGQRFNADSPAGRREFDYPMLWEAPFVLLQGKAGGFLIWAEDAQYRYKNLVVEHARRAFRLRFESRNTAPFEELDRITSSRWRITPYRGPWQAGAALYRRWAQTRYALTPLEQQQPAWVRDIQFVVIMNLDRPLLAELARQCAPAQTLLYLPNWRRDGYDRNYPDYTAATNFGPFVQEARRLGFRIMPHVNYFGCDPKHPLYERFKPWQVRDPFTKALQWWEWPADPPIKFAYINPASRAWRELFVERMRELCRRFEVDALHLDQTLCIYNDANGLIDGMNGAEGNVALHRELRAALPAVALSGEGLNEVTCRYEAFAQRHIWGMDHAHGTWDDRLIALSHPISSAILAPFTKIYGYLGMANPGSTTPFVVWQRAYEHWGVLPTYAWPDRAQLQRPPFHAAELLAQAAFFQKHRPRPDFESPWEDHDLFVYRLAGGGRAAFRRDGGVEFAAQLPGQPPAVLARRIEGASEARLSGSIPGWPAYDDGRIFGLDSKKAYPWSPQPRDLRGFHVVELPRGATLEQSGIHPEFARLRFGRPEAEAAAIRLWDYAGEASPGVRLADGRTRSGDALDFEDPATGATVHPEGEGLFFHPPWKGSEVGRGQTATYLEFALRLPAAPQVAFESAVHLRDGVAGKSDGVEFQVLVTCNGRTLNARAFTDKTEPKPLRLDLSEFAGQAVRLRLEANAGPKSNPTFDWALMNRPGIVTFDRVRPEPGTFRIAGAQQAKCALTAAGPVALKPDSNGNATFTMNFPGTMVIPWQIPEAATLPCDLLRAKFTSHLAFQDGLEVSAFSYFGGAAATVACGSQSRRALSLHPPPSGQSLADYLLQLPAAPVKFATAIGLRDGSTSQGVGFAVQVNGATVFQKSLLPGGGWVPVEVDLSAWRAQPVLLTLLTDAQGNYDCDWAVWAEPALVEAGSHGQ